MYVAQFHILWYIIYCIVLNDFVLYVSWCYQTAFFFFLESDKIFPPHCFCFFSGMSAVWWLSAPLLHWCEHCPIVKHTWVCPAIWWMTLWLPAGSIQGMCVFVCACTSGHVECVGQEDTFCWAGNPIKSPRRHTLFFFFSLNTLYPLLVNTPTSYLCPYWHTPAHTHTQHFSKLSLPLLNEACIVPTEATQSCCSHLTPLKQLGGSLRSSAFLSRKCQNTCNAATQAAQYVYLCVLLYSNMDTVIHVSLLVCMATCSCCACVCRSRCVAQAATLPPLCLSRERTQPVFENNLFLSVFLCLSPSRHDPSFPSLFLFLPNTFNPPVSLHHTFVYSSLLLILLHLSSLSPMLSLPPSISLSLSRLILNPLVWHSISDRSCMSSTEASSLTDQPHSDSSGQRNEGWGRGGI